MSSAGRFIPLAALVAGAGLLASVGGANPTTASRPAVDTFAELPSTISLPAMVRDFRHRSASSGAHPDFQAGVGGHVVRMVAEQLGEDGNPVFVPNAARSVSRQFTDRLGNNINPALFDAARGDRAGALGTGGNPVVQSAASFAQWYEDVPGVNASRVQEMVLHRVPNTNRFVFDSATQDPWRARGGFFPINGELFGNFQNNRNFHFTTELETEFIFERGTGQVFTFTGDDDVWVFIGGRLVIDLGGVHGRIAQTIDLDRLSWLESGMTYTLKVFHAERHTSESNFRIETTMRLRRVEPPATSALFD